MQANSSVAITDRMVAASRTMVRPRIAAPQNLLAFRIQAAGKDLGNIALSQTDKQ
jgi:hypothetical protein